MKQIVFLYVFIFCWQAMAGGNRLEEFAKRYGYKGSDLHQSAATFLTLNMKDRIYFQRVYMTFEIGKLMEDQATQEQAEALWVLNNAWINDLIWIRKDANRQELSQIWLGFYLCAGRRIDDIKDQPGFLSVQRRYLLFIADELKSSARRKRLSYEELGLLLGAFEDRFAELTQHRQKLANDHPAPSPFQGPVKLKVQLEVATEEDEFLIVEESDAKMRARYLQHQKQLQEFYQAQRKIQKSDQEFTYLSSWIPEIEKRQRSLLQTRHAVAQCQLSVESADFKSKQLMIEE